MWNERYSAAGLSLWARANFDPMTLAVSSMAMTAAGGAASAYGTLAGGSYAKQAGLMTEIAMKQEASTAFASGQRQALDTEDKTRRLISTAAARGAAGGVDIGTGSPATNAGQIAQRGSYHALMDMFNGQQRADQLRYEGELARTEGEMKSKASRIAAAATLASTAGSMMKTYGAFRYPTSSGRPSVSLD